MAFLKISRLRITSLTSGHQSDKDYSPSDKAEKRPEEAAAGDKLPGDPKLLLGEVTSDRCSSLEGEDESNSSSQCKSKDDLDLEDDLINATGSGSGIGSGTGSGRRLLPEVPITVNSHIPATPDRPQQMAAAAAVPETSDSATQVSTTAAAPAKGSSSKNPFLDDEEVGKKKGGKAVKSKIGNLATSWRGRKFCGAFNSKRGCTHGEAQCPQWAEHKCGYIVHDDGTVCGATEHGWSSH